MRPLAVQQLDQWDGGGERELFHVLAVGGAQHQDTTAFQASEGRGERRDRETRHRVVDPPAGPSEMELLPRRIGEQEVRVDRDAVPADSDAGLVQVRKRL